MAGLLVSAYDNLGRAYQTTVYGVNVSGGTTTELMNSNNRSLRWVALAAQILHFLTVHGSED